MQEIEPDVDFALRILGMFVYSEKQTMILPAKESEKNMKQFKINFA
jgi:hypothetical protein